MHPALPIQSTPVWIGVCTCGEKRCPLSFPAVFEVLSWWGLLQASCAQSSVGGASTGPVPGAGVSACARSVLTEDHNCEEFLGVKQLGMWYEVELSSDWCSVLFEEQGASYILPSMYAAVV